MMLERGTGLRVDVQSEMMLQRENLDLMSNQK